MVDDRVDHVGGQEDAVVALVDDQPDVGDDASAVALGGARDLRGLADHGAVLDVDVAVTVGGRRVEDGDVDRRDAVAQPVALDGDQLLAGPTATGEPGADARIDERADAGAREQRVLAAPEAVDEQRHRPLRNALQLALAGGGEVEHGAEGLEVAGDQAPAEAPLGRAPRACPARAPRPPWPPRFIDGEPAGMAGRLEQPRGWPRT